MFLARISFAATLAVVVLPAACAASGSAEGDCPADVAADGSCDYSTESTTAHAHPFDVGMSGMLGEIPFLTRFRTIAGDKAGGPRLCHAYTYWDIARRDPPGGTGTHSRAGLIDWFSHVDGNCNEVMITFQGEQVKGHVDALPKVSDFEGAFVAFAKLTDPGQPLAAWKGKLSYTAWNEPNNPAPSGNGTNQLVPAEKAADYYMALRKHCAPTEGCKVAAGDFATNGGTANDIEWNCADDGGDNTSTRCEKPSPFNKTGKAPSYLDRYKHEIDRHATDYGLKKGFRPEVFAYHPWHDVNAYIESNAQCSGYENCATRRLLQSLGGSWGGVEIWDTEIGVGLQTDPAPSKETQACGAAFLVRLTDLSPRITRVYYMRFGFGNGPLFDGDVLRPAGDVLAHQKTTFTGAKCAPSGISMASYANPIIGMFDRPPGAPSGPGVAATEGCPDPSAIKTKGGRFYVYCTSYTFAGQRHDGFPIFESDDLTSKSWKRVGALIPDGGASHATWPKWIKGSDGKPFGMFWAPDVRQLASGKFAATYAAPCGATMCVGMAWSDHPEGPWTHAQTPFVSKANNGAGADFTYDPNLLLASDGAMYLYWHVAGHGIFGAKVDAEASGKLRFVSSPTRVMSAAGEGPYVVEHDGAFFLFTSGAASHHLVYDYEVSVHRASSPLGDFDAQTGPIAIHKSDDANGAPVKGTSFVATGGNSVIQDAIGGRDFMFYHAIVVGDGHSCPGDDPENGKSVTKESWNPYCRVQGERQAMMDPIEWKSDGAGGVWPVVGGDAVPSEGRELLP